MSEVSESLVHHWGMDEQAAEIIGQRKSQGNTEGSIEEALAPLSAEAIKQRDINRQLVADIFNCASSDTLVVMGPCSLDAESDYNELFDYMKDLNDQYPQTVMALRLNGTKPRTSVGWGGLWLDDSVDADKIMYDTYAQAAERGLPIITEITDGDQLGSLAPYLSGAWIGARDIESTALRSKFRLYNGIPVGIKNGTTGDLTIVRNTVEAVRSNTDSDRTKDSNGTLVSGGVIAATPTSLGAPVGKLPVSSGNKAVSIIPRGYELPETMTDIDERRLAAFDYISEINHLAGILGCATIIDGTHSVPPMFGIDRKGPDRFVPVLQEIHKGIQSKAIRYAGQIAGVMGEVGVIEGRTDPNYVLDETRKEVLTSITREIIATMHEARN